MTEVSPQKQGRKAPPIASPGNQSNRNKQKGGQTKESLNMQASITVPIKLNPNKVAQQKQKLKQAVAQQAAQNKKRQQKIGGVLSSIPNVTVPKGTNQLSTATQLIKEWSCTFQELISNSFMLQNLKNNLETSQSSCSDAIDMFRMTESPAEKQKTLQLFRKDAQAKEILKRNKYLASCKDQTVLTKISSYLTIVCRKIFQKYPYLSTSACLKLITGYFDINRNTFYNGTIIFQAFTDNKTQFQNSKTFHQMLKGITQIKQEIFVQYQKVLKMLLAKKNDQVCPFLIKLLRNNRQLMNKLMQNMWHSFSNIVQFELAQNKGKFSLEINLFLTCLNLCFELDNSFFTKQRMAGDIFPLLVKMASPRLIPNTLYVQKLDSFLIRLLFVHPFTEAQFDTNKALNQFLGNQNIKRRFPFLYVLENPKLETFYPMTSLQYTLFIQAFLKRNPEFDGYSCQKHNFIFENICQIFKGGFSELASNKQKYCYIWQYIDYIIRQVYQREQGQQTELMKNNNYLNTCKLAKLISKLAQSSQENTNIVTIFESLTNNEVYTISLFIKNGLQIIKLPEKQLESIQNYLADSLLSSQVIYQLFYKLIISDEYFFHKRKLVLQGSDFRTVDIFYHYLITNFIQNYLEIGTIYNLNIQAFTKLIQTPNQKQNCSRIVAYLSKLEKTYVQVQDVFVEQIITKSILEFSIEKILDIGQDYEINYLPAVAEMILAVLEYAPALLNSLWMKKLVDSFKKLTKIRNSFLIQRYVQALLSVLDQLAQKKDYKFNVENYFDFRSIDSFLHSALVFEYDRENSEILLKNMSSKKYHQINLAVQLIKRMSLLYIKQKESHQERIPDQIKMLMEKENRRGIFELQFSSEATSYALILSVILLSKEFVTDPKLTLSFPSLRQDIYQTLLNLKQVSKLTHFEVNLSIDYLFDRTLQIEVNENFNIQSKFIDHINRNPSLIGYQILRNFFGIKLDQKQQTFKKVINAPSDISNVAQQSHFLLSQLKKLTQKDLAQLTQDQWESIDIVLGRIKNTLNESDLKMNRKNLQKTLSNIFQFSILLKKKNLKFYALLLEMHHQFFLDFTINRLEIWEQFNIFNQAMIYLLSIRSILPLDLLDNFRKHTAFHKNLQTYVQKCLNVISSISQRKTIKDESMLLVQLGIVCILNVLPDSQQLRDWLAHIFQQLKARTSNRAQLSLREIVPLVLLSGRMGQKIIPVEEILQGQYWEVIANALKPTMVVAQMMLLDIKDLYDRHEIFFISFCHYCIEIAKTSQLKALIKYNHFRLNRKFMQIIQILLLKSIEDRNNYYVIWLIQLLSECILNRKINQQDQLIVYNQIRSFFFNQKDIFSRIYQLLSVLCRKMRIVCNRNQLNHNKQQQSLTISQKLELLAYLRLMTFIYFDQKYQMKRNQAAESTQDLNKQKIITQRQKQFQLLMFDLIPLFTKLISGKKQNLIDIQTQTERKLSSMKVEKLASLVVCQPIDKYFAVKQARQVWETDQNVLSLLDEVINYELVSTSSIWISLVVQFSVTKYSLHPSIMKNEHFDEKINNLVLFLDVVIQRMEIFRKYEEVIRNTLTKFQQNIYNSLVLVKQLYFTNSKNLHSQIDTDYSKIVYKLSQVAYVLYKMLESIFMDKIALKSSSALSYRKIYKKLKAVEELIGIVDPHFPDEIKSSDIRTQSERLSRNYTHMQQI